MRKATLKFLKRERDRVVDELELFEQGIREVFQLTGFDRQNISRQVAEDLRTRLDEVEEMIAALETRTA
jgi:DNA-binding transcriptional MerR regulator